jgi:hypothetical protein
MKKQITIIIVLIASVRLSYGQTTKFNSELVDLAKTYRSFHFSNNPPPDVFSQLNSMASPELIVAKEFITELIKTNNNLTSKKFLSKPDSVTLKSLYIIRGLNWTMHEANPTDYNLLIDSLLHENSDYNELLACYYGMLFSAIGNKNRPFDMEDINFSLWDYNLQNDTEKGIFFLMSMETFGTLIWGYMNIPQPPNYKEALRYIAKYPKYNGQPYYQFLDLNFKDFNLTIDKRDPKGSFKKYYLNKYMNTLLYHCLCLSQKNKHDQKRNDVLLGSILKNESYWDYFSNRAVLEKIFTKLKE